MALTRPRLPWTRTRPAADASFFENDGKWRPRPDSPEVSVFTPAEEAESHRRWNRAMLREKFRGPVTDGEQIGLGLSAAAFSALVGTEALRGSGAETAEPDNDSGNVGEVLRALKSAAATEPPEKGPVTAKTTGPAAGPAAQAFLDTGADVAFSSPVSSRTDNGLAARRAAPRSGGAPFESRVAGGAERADGAPAVRKAESGPSEARAPSLVDSTAAVRGPLEADIATVAVAALLFDAPEVRDGFVQVEPRGVNAVRAADGARASAEAPGAAKAKDAPSPVAEARADGRQGPVEASARDKSDAPPAAEAKAAADQGRGGGAEAANRSKGKDAAATADADAAQGRSAADAQAKAKDIACAPEPDSGLGQKQAKAVEQARAREVEAVEVKVADEGRSAADSSGHAKAKDAAPPVFEHKTHSARDHAEVADATTAWGNSNVVNTWADQGREWGTTQASTDQGKAKDTEVRAVETKAEQNPRQAEAALTEAHAKDTASGASGKADAGQGAGSGTGQAKITTLPDTKTEMGRSSPDTPGPSKTKYASSTDSAADALGQGLSKATPVTGDAKTDVTTPTPVTKDALSVLGGKADALGQGLSKATPVTGDAKTDVTTPTPVTKDAPSVLGGKVDPGREQAPLLKPTQAKDGAELAADPAVIRGPGTSVETPVGPAKPKDGPTVPGSTPDPTQTLPDAPGQPKKVPTVVETKTEQVQRPADPGTKPADAVGQEHEASQPATVPARTGEDGPVGGFVPILPAITPDPSAIHVPDLWPPRVAGPEQVLTLVVPREEAASPGLHATAPKDANEPRDTGAMRPAESDPAGGNGAKPVAPGSGEKDFQSVQPVDAAPDSPPGKAAPPSPVEKPADASPTRPSDSADPVGPRTANPTKVGQEIEVSAPGNDAAKDVVLLPTENEKGGNGQALSVDQALADFATPAADDAGPQPHGGGGGGPRGKNSLPEDSPSVLSVPESVWQPLSSDTILL